MTFAHVFLLLLSFFTPSLPASEVYRPQPSPSNEERERTREKRRQELKKKQRSGPKEGTALPEAKADSPSTPTPRDSPQ